MIVSHCGLLYCSALLHLQREIARLRAELEDALERCRQLQQALETEKAQMASTIRRLEQRQGALSRLESEGEGWARLQAKYCDYT